MFFKEIIIQQFNSAVAKSGQLRVRQTAAPTLQPTSVEAEEALIAKHLLCTVKAVLVHQLPHEGARGPLVLHTSLHQVDGVHGRGSRCCGNTKQPKAKSDQESPELFCRTWLVWAEGMGAGEARPTSSNGAQGEPVGRLCSLEPHGPGGAPVSLIKGKSTHDSDRVRRLDSNHTTGSAAAKLQITCFWVSAR